MPLTPIETCLLRTLAWFDLLCYPLTAAECWYYLYQKKEDLDGVTLTQVESALGNLASQGLVIKFGGFWQLSGTSSYRQSRFARARWAIAKRQRALRGARLMSYLPFVRFVGLVNTVAWEVPAQTSDIDLFIIVKSGRLWLARLFVVLAVHWRGWRQYGSHVRDRLCLSFWVTTDQLDLQPLSYTNDPYFKFWIISVIPLLDLDIYQKWQAQNVLVRQALPNWQPGVSRKNGGNFNLALLPKSRSAGLWQWVGEGVFSGRWGQWCETMARRLQWPRLKRYLGDRLNNDKSDVVMTEQVMKLHLNDRRQKLAREFDDKLNQLGIK